MSEGHHSDYCCTLQEVADALNVSVNCVRMTELRALRKLRDLLQERGIQLDDFLVVSRQSHEYPVCSQDWKDSVA